MAFRSILAYLPSASKVEEICCTAATIAHDQNAHLTILTVTPEIKLPPPFGGDIAPQFVQTPKETLANEIADMERTCMEVARRYGVELELRHIDTTRSLIADVVTEHAFSSDIVVRPQATGEEWGPWSELPDRVILNAGRPVLIVPEGMKLEQPPRTVMVAWTDGPQSARATFDALPLLQHAEKVEVVAIKTASSPHTQRSLAVDQVVLALARHGIKAEAATDIRERLSIGEAILEHARERHADALVMGCYGHWPFKEALLGGVSRTILHDPPLPVLMSH